MDRHAQQPRQPWAALAASAAALSLFAAPTAGAATVPAVPGPATVLTVFPWEGSMKDELRGTLCQAPNNCVRVDQFLWDPNGIATIEATIDATPGTKIVFSYSEGARTVTDWLVAHAGDADAPSPDELSFVVIGNPTRAYGGSDSDVMPQTQYQVIDISRQYDFASDFPDNPLNLLTLLNSLMAFTIIHTDYENVDMYDPANIVWKEGNTTYVFVPTENLPLLQPLRNLGLTDLADALNAPLKELVERGYDRSYLPAAEEEPTTPEPTDVRRDSGDIDSLAAESESDVADDDDVEKPSTSPSRDADEGDIETDETTVSEGYAKHASGTRHQKASAPATDDAPDATAADADAETDGTATRKQHRDGDSSGESSDGAV
ncbi:PE-PPE domain-containing protein [Mycobacterium sp. 236(2023)]|uniref:PE-PPE domain-containing protein n=1 Tax=Mycobacterium sp. 236(2023) TaxID=3038163 RepID=UPI002414D9F1|nr:PE-PPE domain-containing protein [Mycobacterium sp. 236(2023)]MDG4666427.1 PE-PPE domain-containing protein [Mycobacterium sp. 236(2023)]